MRAEDFMAQIEEDLLDDNNIYSKAARDMLVEEDELSLAEAAFMEGYDEAG